VTDAGWDMECDVLVAGSGAGALTGAHVAATGGASTVLVESSDTYGGTTAYSGAGLWLPGNHVLIEAGVPDSEDLGRQYLRAVVGEYRTDLQEAFVVGAAQVIAHLVEDPNMEFEYRPFPDYFMVPGSFDMGRDIFPSDIEGDRLGDLLDELRPTVVQERLGIPDKRDMLNGGQALIGRLLLAARGAGVDLRLGHSLQGLIVENGEVVGAEVVADGATLRIRVRTGVLMATGGFETSDELRHRWQDPLGAAWTLGPPVNYGMALLAGMEVGAATDLLEECWWAPGVEFPDGSAAFTLGFRGGVIVDGTGRRYANESLPYDRFGREMRKLGDGGANHVPSWLIFDSRFKGDIPAIVIPPALDAKAFSDAGLRHEATTLEELAGAIGVPADALVAAIGEFNGFAADGADPAFHRGEAPYDKFFADPRLGGPNPCLVPVDAPPFVAVKIVLADLGTKGGLVTDDRARVLSEADRAPIPGLYAAGNTMASMSGHAYPGPGVPIGSCMVFAYLAARDMLQARHGVTTGS
jgi:3-oxosteroid 1-dehydrogenase